MRPALLDLFCGFGGATKGFMAAGWDAWGVDCWDECEKHYPGHFIQADAVEVAKNPEAYFPAMKFDFLWASPPCQEYSVSSQPFKRSREKYTKEHPPDPTLWNAALELQKKLGIPMILENVRGAQKWMGKATWNYGSYYFWGEMPALKPIPFIRENGIRSDRKGFKRKNKNAPGKLFQGQGYVGECDRINGVGKGRSRKVWAAEVAQIPFELSALIGEIYYPKGNV